MIMFITEKYKIEDKVLVTMEGLKQFYIKILLIFFLSLFPFIYILHVSDKKKSDIIIYILEYIYFLIFPDLFS